MQDERARAAIGADQYVASLHEAVEACLAVVHQDERRPLPQPS
jgi:hypothetical protein